MSKQAMAAGIRTFFQILTDGIVAQAQGQIVDTYEVGDSVYYEGSKVADHGYWKVESVDDASGRLTLGRDKDWRQLRVNESAVRHAVKPVDDEVVTEGPTDWANLIF